MRVLRYTGIEIYGYRDIKVLRYNGISAYLQLSFDLWGKGHGLGAALVGRGPEREDAEARLLSSIMIPRK